MPTDIDKWKLIKAERKAQAKAASTSTPSAAEPVAVVIPPAAPIVPPSDILVAKLEKKLAEAKADLSAAEIRLSNASFEALVSEDERAADAVLVEARRVRNLAHETHAATVAALDVALDRQVQARHEAAQARHDAQVAIAKGLLDQRSELAAVLADRLAEAVDAYRNLLSLNTDCLNAWPLPSRPPAGAGLDTRSCVAAVEEELYRLSANPFLGGNLGERHAPAFPGSKTHDYKLALAPDRVPSLVDRTARDTAFLIQALANTRPVSIPKPAAPVAAPVAAVAPSEPASRFPLGPTRTAAEIQAEIPKVRIDLPFVARTPDAPEFAPADADVEAVPTSITLEQ